MRTGAKRSEIADVAPGFRAVFDCMEEGACIIERLPPRPDGRRDYRYLAMNPAMQAMFGVPDLTGQSIRDNFPEGAEGWYDAFEEALASGQPMRLEREAASRGMVIAMSLSPLEGTHGQLLAVMRNVTARRRAEEALRRSEERQSFLLRLSDALQTIDDPMEIQATATAVLAGHLGASRVFYAEVIADGSALLVRHDHAVGVASIAGRHVLAHYDDAVRAKWGQGEVVVVEDVQRRSDLSPRQQAALTAITCRAWMGVPLVKAGRLVAVLAVNQTTPRRWTEDEISLVRDVAERTWAAVERARAEAERHQSEEQYRMLFDSIDEGFCTIEVLFDAEGEAVDYRFLQTNPAFERQTGLAGVVGRTIREMVPTHERHWFEVVGRIVRTGEPARFEDEAAGLGRWYDVYAFRIGEPDARQVAVLFRDVSPRKRAEAALRRSEERARALIDASSDVIYRMSADWREMHELTGRDFLADLEAPTLQWMDKYIFPEDQPALREVIDHAIATGQRFELEHRVRREDGGEGWILSRAIPMRDAGGAIDEWFGMGADVTERVIARDRQRLLNAELGHRMKNLIAVVQAISSQTLRDVADRPAVDTLLSRLRALSRANDLLMGRSSSSALMAEVVQATVDSLAMAERIHVAGPEVSIGSKPVENLALLLHELGTNAVKHGALSVPQGEVDLRWEIEGSGGDATLRIRWREKGGPPAATPLRKGFGSRLISMGLLGTGGVTLDYRVTGLVADIVAPLSELAAFQ